MIGEHCKRLPSELQTRHHELPWRQMVGLRNIVSHAYDVIDPAIVWLAATQRLDDIAALCRAEKTYLNLG